MSPTIAPATQQRSRPDQTANRPWISTPATTGGGTPDEPAVWVHGLGVSVLPRSRPHLFDVPIDGRVKAVQNSRGERKRRRERTTVCSPRRGWRGAKMERHTEMRSVRASTTGERQAASRQFVFLGRVEGIHRTTARRRRLVESVGVNKLASRAQSTCANRGSLYSSNWVEGLLEAIQSGRPMFLSMSLHAISNPQLT